MLLILVAMIVGSSLTAFSLPIGSTSGSGVSGIKVTPQTPSNDAPFSVAPSSPALPSQGPQQGAQRGSLVNLSV